MTDGAKGGSEAPHLDLSFTWRYSHALGELSPFFTGLQAEKAMATSCRVCRNAWFPPRLACPVHGLTTAWIELAGGGTIRAATRSTLSLPLTGRTEDVWLVLVAMDGANNLVTGRMAAGSQVDRGMRVRLAVDTGRTVHPIQALIFRPASTG
ncbi:MAG: hypothetical protein EXQ92_14580 [Alphaproteobacteria bacterium]|nr:hypothetical protein [Alphaproteobacteria bacterium]